MQRGTRKRTPGKRKSHALEDTVPPKKGGTETGEGRDCKICGRRNHTDIACSFRGSNHPLVKSLNGKPFQGSTVQSRLLKVGKEKEDGTWVEQPHKCIPFRKTLGIPPAHGREILIPADQGPTAPAPAPSDNKREGRKQEHQAQKLSFNN